jgi:hypothetical protein
MTRFLYKLLFSKVEANRPEKESDILNLYFTLGEGKMTDLLFRFSGTTNFVYRPTFKNQMITVPRFSNSFHTSLVHVQGADDKLGQTVWKHLN